MNRTSWKDAALNQYLAIQEYESSMKYRTIWLLRCRNTNKVAQACFDRCVVSLRNVTLDSTEKSCIESYVKKYQEFALLAQEKFLQGVEEHQKKQTPKAFSLCETNNPFQNTI